MNSRCFRRGIRQADRAGGDLVRTQRPFLGLSHHARIASTLPSVTSAIAVFSRGAGFSTPRQTVVATLKLLIENFNLSESSCLTIGA